MATQAPTMRDRAAAKWEAAKPIGLGIIIGLIAGPILTGAFGFQTRTSTATAATRAGVVEQQALFCEERARATLPADAGRIEWGRGYDLAKQWAAMPGTTQVESEVAQACARKLTSG